MTLGCIKLTVKANQDSKVPEAPFLQSWPPHFTAMETRLSEVKLLSWLSQGKGLCP